jgi:hypothetical protein
LGSWCHYGRANSAAKDDKVAGWQAKQQEGVAQVQGYLQLPEIAALKNLSAWLWVTDGERVEVTRLS